ncbi:MAG: L,D-transpeptidase, partial [Pseudomonadota bacterium]
IVTDVRAQDARKVTKIEIRKDGTQLYGYGADDKLIWSAPASIGSEQTPSPSGEMKVSVIAPEPNYTFDPDTLRDAKTTEKVVIQPGPNGPVGAMWIGLTKDGYGIHGTPDPAEISRTQSHGCVRLTNWDATALAQLVTPDETEVVFMN